MAGMPAARSVGKPIGFRINSTSVVIEKNGVPFALMKANVASAADLLYKVVSDFFGRFKKIGIVDSGINANAAVESMPPENAKPGLLFDLEV